MQRLAVYVLLFVISTASGVHAVGQLRADFSDQQGAAGIPLPWRIKVTAGKADVSMIPSGEGPAVRMCAEASSFGLERDFLVPPGKIGLVRWLWRVEVLPRLGDVRQSDRNDQAVQVMFAFEGRSIISYVWDSTAPVGTVRDESLPWPVSLKVRVLVVASGEEARGTWMTVQRNLAEDYRRLFGTSPPALRGIRLQTNSQHTGTLGIGAVGPISFVDASPRPGRSDQGK